MEHHSEIKNFQQFLTEELLKGMEIHQRPSTPDALQSEVAL